MDILTTLIAPAITGIITLIGIIIANNAKDAARDARMEEKEHAMEEWRTSVTTRLDEHNNYAKLFSETSVTIARIDERLKNLEERK